MGQNTIVADRYAAVLKANRVALTKCTSDAVFIGMCRVLKTLVRYDRAGLTLYDPDHDSLKIVALYGSFRDSLFRVGDLLGRKSTQNGWTFEHKSKTIRRDLPNDLRFASERQTAEEGFRSLCAVPLIVRGTSIGVITVAGARKNQFSTVDAEVVQQISNQVVLAISSFLPRCPTHATSKLVCPRCIGAAGGKQTVAKHREALSMWGKKGGRGRKNLDFC